MASASVTRAVNRNKAARRGGWFGGFDWRRPFDALWKLFSSVRLAIVLIASLVAIGFVGTLVSQAPREVTDSPLDFSYWVDANARVQYHQFTDLMNWLQLFTIFSSWYFKLIVILLAINILVGGMLQRAPGIWQKFRHSPRKRAEGFYVNSPVRVGLSVGAEAAATPETAATMAGFFKKRGYRVETAPASSEQVTYLYAHQFTWSSLSTFVFHTCLIAAMFSTVVTGWGGFGANSMATRILPAPVYNYLQNLAGFSYDQPMPNGDEGVVYPMGTPHNIFYRAQQFVMTVDPVRNTPTDFYTDLQVFQDGKLVAAKRIRVNDPLTYQGVTFHQASFMMYASIQIRDAQHNVIYAGAIPLTDHRTSTPDPNTGNVFQTNNAMDVPLANENETMNLGAALLPDGHWLVGIKAYDLNSNPVFQGADIFEASCVTPNGTQLATATTFGCALSNGWTWQVNEVTRGTVLLVTKDSGSPLLWPILALLVLSLWVTFSFPPRRFWVRVEGDQVRMAALKEHFVNQQRDLDAFARALGNRPLRPDSPDMPPPESPPPMKASPAKPASSARAAAKKRAPNVPAPV